MSAPLSSSVNNGAEKASTAAHNTTSPSGAGQKNAPVVNKNSFFDNEIMEAIIGRIECNVDTAMSVRAINHSWLKASRGAWDMKCFTTEVDAKKMYLTEKEDAEGKLMCALELSHPDHVETARRILQGEY